MLRVFKDEDFNPDFYETLGISRDATSVEIARAYKKRAKETHPDVNPGNPHAEAEFVAVGRAYEVLKDPADKARYDMLLKGRDKAAPRPVRPHSSEGLSAAFNDAAHNPYANRSYTKSELDKYLDAEARLRAGEYQKGDLCTVFNFVANKDRRDRGSVLEKTIGFETEERTFDAAAGLLPGKVRR